jgi:hypothetical protein
MSEWLIHAADGHLFVSLFVSSKGDYMWEMIDPSNLPNDLIVRHEGKYAFLSDVQRDIADKVSPTI